jgi:type I restriction enzyme M protein
MSDLMQYKKLIKTLGFTPKENTSDIFLKKYADRYIIELDFDKKLIDYGKKIKTEDKTAQNFSQDENWVVLECVNRLLEKGYKPKNITLEKTYLAGHGHSGRLDICISHADGSEYLLIECKTWGKEFDKEFVRMKKDGGQLFTYFKFSNKADIIMLYTSELNGKKIVYRNEIIKIEDDYRSGDVKDFYNKWNKLTKDNGVFDAWVNPYHFISKALTPKLIEPIKQEDSGFIFNRFLEILRHNVVSDKPNAFNKIFTLFLCKIYDEKITPENEQLKFQWLEGIDDDISFQMRLADLYKNGMYEFLEKKVTDFSDKDFEKKYASLFASDERLKNELKNDIIKLRLEKNNEFAIKEVFDEKSFKENAKVVKQVVELLQGFKIRYTKKQQYLSDFFELLLTTGLKQESGQFFTPVPIAQFIIKSIPIDELIEEKLQKGERNNLLPYVMDYAAGSGHFLTEMMHEIQRAIDKKDTSKYISDTAKKIKNWQEDHFDWALQYVYGVEKDYRLVKVGKVGCYLHGDGLANVIHSDGLGNFKETEEYKDRLPITDTDFPKENKQFDMVVSNPPYSVSAFKQNARNYYTEKDFELYEKLTDNSSEIECLFVERAKQLLKDGGMAGIILPSSILSNTGIYTKTREVVLQHFDIVAIAELGSNTFMATGTNTVTLFLRRRNNYDSINLKKLVEKFFTHLQDVTLNGIENPVSKYVNHNWEGISFEDYKTLLQKQPNEAIQQHEIYQEYQKKLKTEKSQEKCNEILRLEEEKLFYFIIVYPQKVVLVKSGQKTAEKQFLGYEFSNRRGSEGIHPIQRGKNIDQCTRLFDADIFDNPEKASTYIYKAFNGDFDFSIHESLQKNISRADLVDMLTFDRVDFEKNISLSAKKKIKIESRWNIVRLGKVANTQYGFTDKAVDNGDIRYLRITDLNDDGSIKKGNKKFINPTEETKNQFLLKNNDIIIARSGSVGKSAIYKSERHEKMIFASYLIRLIINKDKILPKYLFNFTKTRMYWNQVEANSIAVTQPNLNAEKIKDFKIPLPPKDIQEKIVSEIEVLEQKENKAIDMVKGLKENIPNLINSLKNSPLDKLENLCIISSGGTPSMKVPEYWEKGTIPWLKSEVCKEVNVTSTNNFISDLGLQKSSAKYIEPNSTLIALVGATKGKTAFLKFKATTNQNIAGISSKNENILLNKYIYNVLKSMYADIIKNLSQYDMLNITMIKNIKIPLPPLPEQKKIVSKIDKIETKIAKLEIEISIIPEQKESILKKYL